MIVRIAVVIEYVFFLFSMSCFANGTLFAAPGNCVSCDGAAAAPRASQASPPDRLRRGRVCLCKRYRCSCCINFSFIRRWKALGCFHIESLPGNLNILLSFSFNKRHLAVFPIAGSRPMAFCRAVAGAVACLVVYDVRTDTPHDITVCLGAELRVGAHCLATAHLGCVRRLRRRLRFVPARSAHRRKGSLLDVHVMPNDTMLTILRQEFHWTRGDDSSMSEEAGDAGDGVGIVFGNRNANKRGVKTPAKSSLRFFRWIMRPVHLFW